MHHVLPLEQKEYTTSPLVPERQGMVYLQLKWLVLNASVFRRQLQNSLSQHKIPTHTDKGNGVDKALCQEGIPRNSRQPHRRVTTGGLTCEKYQQDGVDDPR